MNDNQKSPQDDIELDFDHPKQSDKIVDSSMIQSRVQNPADVTRGAIVVGVIVLILGYSFFFHRKAPAPASHPSPIEQLAKDAKKPVVLPEHAQEVPSMTHHDETVAAMPEEKKIEPTPESNAQPIAQSDSVDHKPTEPAIVPEPTAPVAAQPPVVAPSMPQPPVAPVVKPTTPAPVAPASTASSQTAPQSDLSQLTQLINQQQKQIAELSSRSDQQLQQVNQSLLGSMKKNADDLAKALQTLQQSQKNLEQALQNLASQFTSHDQELKRIDHFVQNQITDFAQPLGIIPAPQPVPYSVHAIIPGRAWLKDRQNKIFSVTEGQEIPDHGKVLTIDPRLGTVILSSGQVLRY